MNAKRIIFTGRVQGVGFRYQTKQLAQGFDVTGTVKNIPDGTVELLLGGEDKEVDDFVREILHESELSHHIKSHTIRILQNPPDFKGFTIAG